MPAYISSSRSKLDFHDVPVWCQNFLRKRRVIGDTPQTLKTAYLEMREFCCYIAFLQEYGHAPSHAFITERTEEDGTVRRVAVDEIEFFRNMDVRKLPLDTVAGLKKRDIQMYHFFIADTLDNEGTTQNKKLSYIKSFYEYLVEEQLDLRDEVFEDEDDEFRRINCLHIVLDSSPAAKISGVKPKAKQPVVFPRSAVIKFLRSISGPDHVRDYAIILMFFTTGLRVSELCRLNMNDITEDRVRINGKGNKQRTVFLTSSCIVALDDYIQNYRAPLEDVLLDPNALFVSSRARRRLTERAVQKIFKRQLMYAGLDPEKYTVHKARHTFATMLIESDTDLMTVMNLMGHESPVTTAKYTHLSSYHLKDAVLASSLNSLGENSLGISDEDLDFIISSDLAQQDIDFALQEVSSDNDDSF